MIVTLTDSQMLKKWRRGALLEPAVADCSIERFDGLEVDDILRQAMRTWYLGLLADGDPRLVKAEDSAREVTLTRIGGGRWLVNTKADTVRILDLAIAGCDTPVRILNENNDEDLPEIRALDNRFLRIGKTFTAVVGHDGRLTLTGGGDTDTPPVISRCMVVSDPGDELYVLDERLLQQIPALARQLISE